MTSQSNLASAPPVQGGFIPLIAPELRGSEWTYVKECLDTAWVSSVGQFVDKFERDVACYVGAGHAVATINGTAALHIALLVAGVQPEDEVLVPTLTFIAPVNAIRYVGAWPVFVDVESAYMQMDSKRVADFLWNHCVRKNGVIQNKRTGRRIKAILPVHILGHPVDMDPVVAIAREFGLTIIEDATEGLGASYKQRSLGSLGDIACFSFNGNKIITTGGGGMIVTDNEEWARKARHLTTQAKADPVEYIHDEVGYNYRLTNMQAALGCGQIEHLNEFVQTKRRISHRYNRALADVAGLQSMSEASWAFSSCWMHTIRVEEDRFGMSSRDLMRALNSRKIQTRPLWQPIHQSKAHRAPVGMDFPVAEELYRDALSLPCSVGLTDDDQTRVIHEIQSLYVAHSNQAA